VLPQKKGAKRVLKVVSYTLPSGKRCITTVRENPYEETVQAEKASFQEDVYEKCEANEDD
jgi:hypothetical protein